jgi:hypothetical protein
MSDQDNYVPAQPDEKHFQICQRAAETLGRLVDGNGLKADQVRLARHETLVHQVPGFVQVELKPGVTSRQLKGNVPAGKVLGAKGDVMGEAAGLVRDFVNDRNIQEQVLQDVRADAGQGFGMDPFKIALPATAREFCVVETCLKCNGAQFCACQRCGAQGQVSCPNCGGEGYQPCQQCSGSGVYMRGGTERVPCQRCAGQGRMQCVTCQGQRQTRCTLCAGQGRIGCTECDQSGYWTNMLQLTFQAEGQFGLDRQQVPKEVLDVIDALGVRNLATKNLAEVFRAGIDARDKLITIPLIAFLPIAQAEFSIEGKAYPATVAGLTGRILAIPPVLDAAIKPGISALVKLSKGPMAAQALIDAACRYRIIRQALAGLARGSKRQVYQQIVKEYPVGLSDKYAKALVKYAGAALLAIGRAPRMKGLAIGCAGAAALSAAWFLSPLRAGAATGMAQAGHLRAMPAADVMIWLAGYAAALLAVKLAAAGALKKLLPENVKTEGRGLPAAGQQGWQALGVTLAIWLALAFTAPARPEWIAALLKAAGHG